MGGGGAPGNAGGGCGDGVGDAVTDMSSSGGERGAPAVVRRPIWVGEVLGEVVLWAGVQLMEMGPRDVDVGSENSKINDLVELSLVFYLKIFNFILIM